ncbi:peptidoglycan DD-metalloendopeptidase family protein [uncultured Clostridium sp.]|jgi:murein DD-endopeptidase MepM/ murein hydrolase activator NlpD|uniref:peptidoglycan DD-metalloendopeptidase family protein n=1 Tax=uncultured Clostridium sp. TaxID=59620 RepID=UPI00261CE058|nr:peptidoglycan DD-metalloendopeptidase family protein [uncultured Clostridium sp.]
MDTFLRCTRRYSFLLVILIFFSNGYGMTSLYKGYVNNTFVGYVQDKEDLKEIYDEIFDDINYKFSEVDKGKNTLKFENTSDLRNVTSGEELRENMISVLNVGVDAYGMYIDEVNIGYVEDFILGDKVIDNLKKKAVESNLVDEELIVSVAVQGDVSYNKEKVKIGKLSSTTEILDNIESLNSNRNNKIGNVEVLEVTKDIEAIKPRTAEVVSEKLCLGEVMRKEGTIGSKEVEKKKVYVDGTLVRTEVLAEKVIKKPTDNIVYKGIQNPVASGFAFLSYPSKDVMINSPYGRRWGTEHHSGIDLNGRTGDSIAASFEGVVKYAGWLGGYGNVVILNHGSGVETLYAHASKLTCATGQRVSKGDKIAEVGSTGRSTGPHIHFELRNNGKAINPMKYFK